MPTSSPWSILLIEKSKDLQSLIRLSIDLSIDATVHIVHSVSEAIELLKDSLPDLILLGFDSNGLESLRELRALPIVETIPVIALTNRVRRSDKIQIQAGGARAILQYPFDPMHLELILQELR